MTEQYKPPLLEQSRVHLFGNTDVTCWRHGKGNEMLHLPHWSLFMYKKWKFMIVVSSLLSDINGITLFYWNKISSIRNGQQWCSKNSWPRQRHRENLSNYN